MFQELDSSLLNYIELNMMSFLKKDDIDNELDTGNIHPDASIKDIYFKELLENFYND